MFTSWNGAVTSRSFALMVRAPNRYGVPTFYELHLWVWEHNQNGLFNDWNSKVSCP